MLNVHLIKPTYVWIRLDEAKVPLKVNPSYLTPLDKVTLATHAFLHITIASLDESSLIDNVGPLMQEYRHYRTRETFADAMKG